jgi:hypothetical protein
MIASHYQPELRQLFGAYLNADVAAEYGSVPAAIAAYARETSAEHRRAALLELVRLRATTSSHAAFAQALIDLGCEVAFADPAAAHALAEQLVDALREEAEGAAREHGV